MPTNNSLRVKYFCYFYSHRFGYAMKNEHRPDYQVENLDIFVGAVTQRLGSQQSTQFLNNFIDLMHVERNYLLITQINRINSKG